jgi:hypothetical protein
MSTNIPSLPETVYQSEVASLATQDYPEKQGPWHEIF